MHFSFAFFVEIEGRVPVDSLSRFFPDFFQDIFIPKSSMPDDLLKGRRPNVSVICGRRGPFPLRAHYSGEIDSPEGIHISQRATRAAMEVTRPPARAGGASSTRPRGRGRGPPMGSRVHEPAQDILSYPELY